jgi:hypothetical protein
VIASFTTHLQLVHTTPEPGRGSAFLVLLAFLLAFGFIRTSARLTRSVSWWPGGVQTDSGLHIHHLVWGIVLLLVSGFVAFATEMSSPWWQITSIGFGVGAGFTLDEFALWLRLQDVYWSNEGRASVDAVVMAAVFGGLVVVGVQPFGLDEGSSIGGTIAVAGICLALSGVAFMKGRIFLGLIGLFVPVFSVWGAVRLGKPTSPWAKHRYSEHRLEAARRRFDTSRRSARIGQRILDAIGGAPSEPDPPPAPAQVVGAPAREE